MMGRDIKKDQKFFNCSEKHELDYVVSLYKGNEEKVRSVLEQGCANNEIRNYTHMQVYLFILRKTSLAIPGLGKLSM